MLPEDFDENKSTDEALYFFPAGTTKGSTKYQLDTTNGVTIYINGVESSKSIAELRDYLDKNETASVTLQRKQKLVQQAHQLSITQSWYLHM